MTFTLHRQENHNRDIFCSKNEESLIIINRQVPSSKMTGRFFQYDILIAGNETDGLPTLCQKKRFCLLQWLGFLHCCHARIGRQHVRPLPIYFLVYIAGNTPEVRSKGRTSPAFQTDSHGSSQTKASDEESYLLQVPRGAPPRYQSATKISSC